LSLPSPLGSSPSSLPLYLELLVMLLIDPQRVSLQQRQVQRLIPLQQRKSRVRERGEGEIQARDVMPRAKDWRLVQPALLAAEGGGGRGGGREGGGILLLLVEGGDQGECFDPQGLAELDSDFGTKVDLGRREGGRKGLGEF